MKTAAISLLAITLIGVATAAVGIAPPASPAVNLFGAMTMVLAASARSLGLWMARRADEARRLARLARGHMAGKLDEVVAAANDVRDFMLCLRADVLRALRARDDRCEKCDRCIAVRMKAVVLVSMASALVVDAVQY